MEEQSSSNRPKMTRPSNNEKKATSPVYAPTKAELWARGPGTSVETYQESEAQTMF